MPKIKIILKQLAKVLMLLIIIALVIRLFFYDNFKNWISIRVQNYLTELDYGDLQIDNIELSVFQHFPDISVQLNKVRFYEAKDSIRSENTQPIFYTEQFNLAFSSWELIRHKHLVVKKLRSKNGMLNLLTYDDSTTNLERVFKTEITQDRLNDEKEFLSIDLEAFDFNNFILTHTNSSEGYTSQVKVTSLSGELLLNETVLSCDFSTFFEITQSSELPMIAKLGPAELKLNLDFINATEVVNIHSGSIRFETIFADLKGTYNNSNKKHIDINFDASSNDLAILSKLIKEDLLLQNSALIKKADVNLEGHIKGDMEGNIPEVDLNFSVSDLSLIIPKSKSKFSNIGFEGELHTGEADDFSGAKLAVKNIRGELPGGSMSGSFSVYNFKNPSLKSSMNVALDIEGFDDVFNLSSIDSLKGKLNFTSEIDSEINGGNQHKLDDIGLWSLSLENIGFKHVATNKYVDKLQGNISETKNEVAIDNLSMRYENSDITINGRIKNLYHFIFSKEQNIEAELELNSSQFYTSNFLFSPNGIPLIEDRLTNLLLRTKITMVDNNSYDSYFPKVKAEIIKLSFDLDSLPSVIGLSGELAFEQTRKGLDFDIKDIKGVFPYGNASLNGKVFIPQDFNTLNIKANMGLSDLPLDYVEDLIYEMIDLDLLAAKHRSKEEMTLINGGLNITGILDLFPFAAHSAEIKTDELSFNQKDSSEYNFENLNIQLDSLYFLHDTVSKSITGIKKIQGKLNVASLDLASIKNIPAYINIEGINDKLKIDFTTSKDIVSNHEGNLSLDISEDALVFDLLYNKNNISAKELIEDYNSSIGIKGNLNTALKFSGTGSNLEEIESSLKGNIEISSDSLIFEGIDLDDILKKYNRSQKFNLADVSAFVIAGPFGAVVTKGSDFTSLISADLKPEQKTYISRALARWSLNSGVLQSEDVAFSTKLNRLAFNGSLNIIKDSIPGFTVYVVDKNGCSIMQQTLRGKTDNLQMGKLKITKALLGSVINAVKSVVGSNCEIVYEGEIEHPNSNK